MKDIIQKCVEISCGKDFIINVMEQDFFTRKNLPFPKRCKDCRAKRKLASKPLVGGLYHPSGGEHQKDAE